MATTRPVPPETLARQRVASSPDTSAWVSANAGSGKTHVLTQRVIRLLLDGVPASRILCLTFTKAAAANMAARVFDTLARWTALDDEDLERAIIATGATFRPELATIARKLFSRTMETPGGLKIQTIHAFCELVLHLFPFEANVPAGFEVIDESQREELLARARSDVFAGATVETRAALDRLAEYVSIDEFDALITAAIAKGDVHAEMARDCAEWPGGYASLLAPVLGLGPEDTIETIERAITRDGFSDARLREIATLIEQGGASDRICAARIRDALEADDRSRVDAYIAIFFSEGVRRGAGARKIITKAVQKIAPDLLDRLERETDRIEPLIERRKAAAMVDRGAALMVVVNDILSRYRELKHASGQLDFEDLIERARMLLTRFDAQWVLYKLDSGIDHILIDEAQDTSRAQWEILDALAAEFTSGVGAGSSRRTFFAVGDEKQSIFSFQGAEPRLFASMSRAFETKLRDARKRFESVNLTMSFRSAPGVLEAVDAVFRHAANRDGVASEDIELVHHAWKRELPSHVEVWEPVGPLPNDKPPDWRLPLDAESGDDPAARLSARVAELLARLLDPSGGESVHDDTTGAPRPIHGGDIMILLRRRGALFESLIRALKRRGLPVAGADRLVLKNHIAAMDLVALGKYCLQPADDLSLACVLKSPLIGLNDDDLIMIAPRRKGSLHDALRGSDDARHVAAAAVLDKWRAVAARSTPFSFYACLLDAEGGRAALMARLGAEAGDTIDEFLRLALDREKFEAPSLARFLHHVETSDVEVKRDMEAAGGAIRVMTAHASKGLEAKIVVLPDTCQVPTSRHDPRLFVLSSIAGGRVLAWSSRMADDCRVVAVERERLRAERLHEYRRLLYVAMTRAEERLYVMGHHGARQPAEGCWHGMIANALRDRMSKVPAFWNAAETVLRLTRGDAPSTVVRASVQATFEPEMPPWLMQRANIDASPRAIRPSRARDEAIGSAGDELRGLIVGRLMHEFLRMLPDVEIARREEAARKIARAVEARIDAATRDATIKRALALIDHPDLRPLFAAGSIAEVAIAGDIEVGSGKFRTVDARVDRVAMVDGEVWFVDFKTGESDGDDIPASYGTQLALYAAALAESFPGKPIRAFLAWTTGPRIVAFTRDQLATYLAALDKPSVEIASEASAP